MQVIKEDGAAPIKAWVGSKTFDPSSGTLSQALLTRNGPGGNQIPDIEDSALDQLQNVARLPFIHKNGIAVMPDVHWGNGASVGSVIAGVDAVIPSAVGVDIGCGMVAIRLSLKASDLPVSLAHIRGQIERDVPTGFSEHNDIAKVETEHRRRMPVMPDLMHLGLGRMSKNQDTAELFRKALKQLGSLGGGNHFIELCIDENQDVWVMLHSGSRGIGNKIGSYYIDRAKELCARWHVELPHGDLAYLPKGDPVFDEYIEAVQWAQQYAFANRALMLDLVLVGLRRHLPEFTVTDEAINCHHNYIAQENHFGQNLWVTRKGAVRARQDDLGIIPGSMGQRSYIVRGKGNAESYCSCSHGAGRAMSRTEAKKRFSLQDLADQTKGVECRKDAAVIDEIPGSYKSLDVVMANQVDLVDVVHQLQAVLCVKGA
jgi:tRNA-splicing ligase RtcB